MINEYDDDSDDTEYDLIFLYANPLVSDICDIPFKEQIDFEKEMKMFRNVYNSIIDNDNSKTSPKIIIDIATIDNLYKYLRYKTKIFHLSCHGCYDPIKHIANDNDINTDLLYSNDTNINDYNDDNEETEYTLYLENLGVVSKLTKSELIKHITDNYTQFQIDLLFLSACHSEEIKDIFIDKKVKAVISISSLCEISEDSAMAFSKVFYKQIVLYNKSIQEAFTIAKTEPLSTFSDEGFDCSCHHHTSTCNYSKYIEDSENDVSNCKCNNIPSLNNESKYSELNIHKFNCDYANFLIKNYNFLYEVNQTNQIQRLCCCSLDIIHNESSKFILYNSKMITLYKDNKPKSTIAPQVINDSESKYDFIPGVIGRKRDLINAIRLITSPLIRLMIINGEEGIGKYSFAHILFKYCYNRMLFKDGVISISSLTLNETIVINELKHCLHFNDTDGNELVIEKLKEKDLMIIIKDNEGYTDSVIQLLLAKTEKLKVIITSNPNRKVLLKSDKEMNIHLKPLDDYYSLGLFNYLTHNKYLYQIENQTDNKLNLKELILTSKGIHSNIYALVNELEHNNVLIKQL